MRQKSTLKVRKDDHNQTPPEATWALMRHEQLPKDIWEPCAGRGAIVRELHKCGHVVAASDLVKYDNSGPNIATGVDFLMETRAPFGIRTIVTNPPFKLADQFILHGLGLGCRVIVLLRLAAMEGVGRSEIIDNHLRRVWLGRERLPMLHREGYTGKKLEKSAMPFAWFVFDYPPHRPDTGFTVRRISWYGHTPACELPEGTVSRYKAEKVELKQMEMWI